MTTKTTKTTKRQPVQFTWTPDPKFLKEIERRRKAAEKIHTPPTTTTKRKTNKGTRLGTIAHTRPALTPMGKARPALPVTPDFENMTKDQLIAYIVGEGGVENAIRNILTK